MLLKILRVQRKLLNHKKTLALAFLLVYFFLPILYDQNIYGMFRFKMLDVDNNAEKTSGYTNHYDLNQLLRFYNKLGQRGSNISSFHFWLNREIPSFRQKILADFDLDYVDSSFQGKLSTFSRETEEMSTGVGQLNLVVVSCEDRRPEALAMIRSALLMSQDAKLNIIAFVDYSSMQEFGAAILKLKWEANRVGIDFRFELKKTWFPVFGEWKGMYRPCATQRLFLPITPSLCFNSVRGQVDTDVLFLSNVTEHWDYFSKMDSKQFATMVANDEMPGNGYYNLHSRVPYFGPRGLNAGIILMNLTRMREFSFEEKCLKIYEEFGDKIILADQDILNILFYQNPELLLEISCAYNFRSSHCDCQHDDYIGQNCKCTAAMKNGVSVVHGNQLSFHKSNYPFFRKMFNALNDLKFGDTPIPDFLHKLQREYDEKNKADNPCFDLTVDMFYHKFQHYISKIVKPE